ncbi:MAG: DUF4330 family protein [Acidobacteria bacterium]|nr:DUF4330 family protein [Acidobacteriota bacterium]
MAVIDGNGRLFGRVNLFDAAAIAVALIIVALTVVGYRLLRVPVAPKIITVTPATLTPGPDLRITVTGRNLLPYMRVFLQRTARPNAVMNDVSPAAHFDSYVLVNLAQAKFLVESPELAEVRLPDGLLPGTYDLILYNETNIVAVREAAFTVALPQQERSARISATIRFVGRQQVLALAHDGDVDVSPGDGEASTIVSIEHRAEVNADLSDGIGDGRVRGQEKLGVLECVVRIPVTRVPTGWWYRGQSIKAGAPITFQTDQYTMRGAVESFKVVESWR